jgi:hypothetical protein
MDSTSFLVGAIFGGIVVVLMVTATGREVTARVGRATGERLARKIEK